MMWNKTSDKAQLNPTNGLNVSLQELIALRQRVFKQAIADKHKRLKLSGEKLTPIRGRGIEFDATREYQPGDDIRSMAWRVTARSLKPHIKVYHEERERPVWFGLDLSPSLYFGTRQMFKSVSIIKRASTLGWSYLQKRDRIGAVMSMPNKTRVYQPHASERNFLAILNAFAQCSQEMPAYTENNSLLNLLLTLQQQVRTGSLLVILSDFFVFDAEIQKLILHLAERVQVELVFAYDPFEAEAPVPHQYMLTNGSQSALFNMDDMKTRQQYQEQFHTKQTDLQEFARRHNMGLQLLRTDQIQEV